MNGTTIGFLKETKTMSFSQFKMILRIMIQNRRSTLINFLGLVLGLTSFVIIFSWIRTEYSIDRFHQHKGRLFHLVIQFPEGILDSNTPYALAPEMKDAFPEVADYSREVRMATQINSSFDFFPEDPDNEPEYEPNVARVDTGFFSMFSFDRVYGAGQNGLDRPDGVLLSKKLAEKYFEKSNPVGRQILMNVQQLLEITGVVDIPENTHFKYDLFLPTQTSILNNWTWRDPSYLLLKEDVSLRSFEKKIVSFLNETYPNPLPGEYQLKLVPVEKANLAFGKKKEFLLFSGIALLLLLIVAINYMNLSTANYTKRIREMGIRKIIGATPVVLRRQLLAETLIQTTVGMFIALFLAEILLPRLSTLFDLTVRIGYKENPLILAGFACLILVFGLLSVSYPVLVFTRGNPTTILRDTFVKGKGRSNVLLITTIFQFTVSVCLLISTMAVLKQVKYAKHVPPGVNVEDVIKVELNPQLGRQLKSFIQEVEAHSGVLEITAGQKNPINEDYKTNIEWPGRDPAIDPLVRYSICLPNFPTFFGHEIVYGRLYSDSSRADLSRYLVNEAACNMLGKENPVGDKLTMWGEEGEIVGVFRNFHHISLHSEIMPHVITINPAHYRQLRFLFIRLSPGDQSQTIEFIRETFGKLASDFPFSYEYLSEEVDQMYSRDVRLARIIGSFAFLALLISCLGIYGLARFSVEKKARDLTIRRVFGASFQKIILLANLEMLRRIGVSVVMAVPLSFFLLERWLRSFAYRTELAWWFFLLGGVLGIVITIAATMIGIWRALQQKPTEVLNQV
ncbi:MAG: FtsX-like permease family protein [Bacteroidia bacterium]|nr:MAG: FtsX-like permease family protein [Bacteroidia bacterium]